MRRSATIGLILVTLAHLFLTGCQGLQSAAMPALPTGFSEARVPNVSLDGFLYISQNSPISFDWIGDYPSAQSLQLCVQPTGSSEATLLRAGFDSPSQAELADRQVPSADLWKSHRGSDLFVVYPQSPDPTSLVQAITRDDFVSFKDTYPDQWNLLQKLPANPPSKAVGAGFLKKTDNLKQALSDLFPGEQAVSQFVDVMEKAKIGNIAVGLYTKSDLNLLGQGGVEDWGVSMIVVGKSSYPGFVLSLVSPVLTSMGMTEETVNGEKAYAMRVDNIQLMLRTAGSYIYVSVATDSTEAGHLLGAALGTQSQPPSSGTKPLSNAELSDLVKRHFPDGTVPQTGENIRATAYSVARAESTGLPSAIGDSGQSIGLWQINLPSHPEYNKQSLLDPDYNASAAKTISSNGLNWSPWSAWKNQAYKDYLFEANIALGVATYQLVLDETAMLPLTVGVATTISGTINKNGVPATNISLGVHDGIRQQSYLVTTDNQGKFSFSSTPREAKPAVVEYLSGNTVFANSVYQVKDRTGNAGSWMSSEIRFKNATNNPVTLKAVSPFGNQLLYTVQPGEIKTVVRTSTPAVDSGLPAFTFRPTLSGGVFGTVGVGAADFTSTLTVDNTGVSTVEFTGGVGVLLRFSVYSTSALDKGKCWSPGGAIGAGGGAEIGADICLGTDGVSIGASFGVGILTGGFSIQVIE